jgi:parvulin-like peptidyl-prolyl isomerase
MSDVDLRLPDEKRAGAGWRPPRPSRLPLAISALTLVLLVAFIVLDVLGVLRGRPAPGGPDPWLDKQVAERLANAGQYAAAAAHLEAYAARAKLPKTERARVLYRVADYLMRAGEYERALAAFYRSELTAKLDELELDIKAGVKRCYEQLGNVAGWEQELKRVTDVGERRPTEGAQVVAELAGRRITMLELDQLIEARISLMLSQAPADIAADQLAAQKTQLLQQFSTSEAKRNFLEGYLEEQVLMREALARGYQREPETLAILDQIRTGVLAQRVRDDEARASAPTKSDLMDYYQSHKEEFVQPERAQVSLIMLDTREAAEGVIEALKGGADFAELAKARSVHGPTRNAGGVVEGDVTRAAGVPGFDRRPELLDHIFALAEGAVSAEPLERDGKFLVVKVRSLTPRSTRPFEEVEAQVRRIKSEQRRAELVQALVKTLMTKYSAAIHPAAFAAETPDQPAEDSPPQ